MKTWGNNRKLAQLKSFVVLTRSAPPNPPGDPAWTATPALNNLTAIVLFPRCSPDTPPYPSPI